MDRSQQTDPGRSRLESRVGAILVSSSGRVPTWRVLVAYLSGQRGGKYGDLANIRIALAVVFSAALAGLAVGYASSFITAHPWPVVIGLAWAFMIANLDAIIVALIRDRAGAARWAAVGPRVIIVAVGAALFSEAISIRLFQPEIEEHLARQRIHMEADERAEIEASYQSASSTSNAHFGGYIQQHESTFGALQGQIAAAEDRRQRAGQDALNAIKRRPLYYDRDGNAYYDSAASRAAQAEEQRVAAAAERLRTDLKPEAERERGEVERLRGQQVAEQARIDKRREDDLAAAATVPSSTGLVARVQALGAVCSDSATVSWFRALLSIFLMALELLPTITKLGERADAAFVRERLHRLLRESLESPEMRERLRLWMEHSSHRYVDQYLRDVDAEMDVHRAANDVDSGSGADPVESADERVRRLIQRKAETTLRHLDAS